MVFVYPNILWTLLVLPLLALWYILKDRKTKPTLRFSHADFNGKQRKTIRQRLHPILPTLRILTVGFLIVAMARPQSSSKNDEKTVHGIDIVMAMDVSSSMLAEDFRPNRLEAAKQVASDFITARKNDRIALVAFSGEAYTQCPLTIDKSILLGKLKELKSGVILDGTAIGDGLAVGVNRIKNSEAKSKVIILLTDGINNMGNIDPVNAAETAKLFDIRMYAIGVGTIGTAPYPVQTPFGKQYVNVPVEIDEKLLTEMSDLTGGKYFRATNKNKLQSIFEEIDKLEKTRIEVLSYQQQSEEYKLWVLLALISLCIEMFVRYVVIKTLP
ncbi:MAG: VWA domain-containing protein [Bacteroidales bacterium]|nr:VWA domain-containing protein [Bacteroidales bacterium]